MRNRGKGFTLIEIMITVAVVAILLAVALPAYQEQLRKGRRAEGKAALLKTIQLQERFYTASVNSSYTLALGDLYGSAGRATVFSGADDPLNIGWYTLSADQVDCGVADLQSCVRIVATPRNFTDANCGILTLNSRGVQTEGGTRDLTYCWRG